MKIGILGGTFDPIHRGHLALARHARRQFKLDQVLFVLSARPPHKKDLRPLTPVKHRLAMVKLAVSRVKGFKVSDMEVRRKGPSYTIDTLRELRKKYPIARIYLILGQDSYEALDRWRRPDEIKKMANFLVAERPGNLLPHKKGMNTFRIRMPLFFVASTELRKAFKKGSNLDDYLSRKVIRYIKTHRLYKHRP